MRDADIVLDPRGDILTAAWGRSEFLRRLQEIAKGVVFAREYLQLHERKSDVIDQVIQAEYLLEEAIDLNVGSYGDELRERLNQVEDRLHKVEPETAGKNFYTYVCFLRRDIECSWVFSRDVVDVLENIN